MKTGVEWAAEAFIWMEFKVSWQVYVRGATQYRAQNSILHNKIILLFQIKES